MKNITLNISYNTSEHNLEEEFYKPCLQWAVSYDRGVGYFTSGWIYKNAQGLSDFVSRGGHIRWIISPVLSSDDYNVIVNSTEQEARHQYFRDLLLENVEQLATEMEADTLNVFAWLLHDSVLEIRFAIPRMKLEDGDFHDKFGVFSDGEGRRISFVGSINDTWKGFVNYESIKVFMSWKDGVKEYVEADTKRFQELWENRDNNVELFSTEEAIRDKVFQLRTGNRPYHLPKNQNLWRHQDEAVAAFLTSGHGLLEMATGTGKTRTALQIMNELFDQNKINRCLIIVDGKDLLKQWEKELRKRMRGIQIFRYFDAYKEFMNFLLWKRKGILLLSREAEWIRNCLEKLEERYGDQLIRENTMLVFDEVHGMGSDMLREQLKGKLKPYSYRLGLSATPERDYDQVGNDFIRNEIGEIIYRFGLEDAIKRGILCEFDYEALPYNLTQEERNKKKSIIARYEYYRKKGVPFQEEALYRDLANVNKTSEAKLPLFKQIISQEPALLERSIIFVENKNYGEKVQRILAELMPDYHTYYSEDRPEALIRFAKGELKCLITCKKISEGVDIKTVKSIILFACDRGRLVVTQRIGRSLRMNPEEPDKRAKVVDFICNDSCIAAARETADEERMAWLSELARIRKD